MKYLFLLIALAFPMGGFAQPLAPMAKSLASGVAHSTSTRIAVLDFSYADGRVSAGPAVIQERLTTALVQERAGTIVERRMLNRVLGELKFQRNGSVDEATIKRLGKVLGVDYVVTGTLNDVSVSSAEVNARLIDAETAAIVSAAVAVVDKTWRDGLPKESELLPEDVALFQKKLDMDAQLALLKAQVRAAVTTGTTDLEEAAVLRNTEMMDKAFNVHLDTEDAKEEP